MNLEDVDDTWRTQRCVVGVLCVDAIARGFPFVMERELFKSQGWDVVAYGELTRKLPSDSEHAAI